jgi:uncharacterized protein (TIGR03437 family)
MICCRNALSLALACGVLLIATHGAAAQTLVATPSLLTFRTVADSLILPPPQTIQITSPQGNVSFSIAVFPTGTPPKDPVFVSVNPSSGTTPATVTVTVMPEILSWGYGGYYNGLGIGSRPIDPGAAFVNIILLVDLPPPPVVKSVVNAASLQPGISPGALVTIFGDRIGPAIPTWGSSTRTIYEPNRFFVSPLLNSTRVWFDGTPAPLLWANAGQVNAVVPYEVAGKTSVEMVLGHSFQAAPPVTVPVLETSPGVFTANGSGSGQGAILGVKDALNSAENPAPAGSTIQIWATGAGVWDPTVPTGLAIHPIPPFPVPAAPVTVTIGGQPAQVTYAGGAPGYVSGVLQVNAVVPDGLAPGSQPVVLRIGQNDNSQQQVTVAVQ